jgi:hypothetical protein
MTEDQFWALIDKTRKQAKNDPDQHMELLQQALTAWEVDDIRAFEKHWWSLRARSYTWDLWAAAYLLGGGCSDDAFMDFRGWLISKGRKVYENALKDPDTLASAIKPSDGEGQIEGFSYIAPQVLEERGEEPSDHDQFERQPKSPIGEPFDEDDMEALEKRFPKLAKLAENL